MLSIRLSLAVVLTVWYVVMVAAACYGFVIILRRFRQPQTIGDMATEWVPVTIIRPIKGIDPGLHTCLQSSFDQDYPRDKLQIIFCVEDANDPAMGTLRRLVADHPDVDAQILVSSNYNAVNNKSDDHYGPNPKVNNLAKGVVAAKHDLLWIMDLNVWALRRLLKNAVYGLQHNLNNGDVVGGARRVGLINHVPLAVLTNPLATDNADLSKTTKFLGARLDEMFLMTLHSKFYCSLNNLNIAPCVNGKLNLYRRLDLDHAVALIGRCQSLPFFNTAEVRRDARYFAGLGPGHAIKFFARYIGEDNMIAIALWEHAMLRPAHTGDVVVQPLLGLDNTVRDYTHRRERWLRVRKYMVLLATMIEPTTELLVCGMMGNVGLLTLLWGRWFTPWLFLLHMTIWAVADFYQYRVLVGHIKCPPVPYWISVLPAGARPVLVWLFTWAMRELLALPIWVLAMMGHEIDWRGKPFKILKDLTAREL